MGLLRAHILAQWNLLRKWDIPDLKLVFLVYASLYLTILTNDFCKIDRKFEANFLKRQLTKFQNSSILLNVIFNQN